MARADQAHLDRVGRLDRDQLDVAAVLGHERPDLVERALETLAQRLPDEPVKAQHGVDERVGERLAQASAGRGCPASSQTLTEGVEKSIRTHCPEIANIVQVSKGAPEAKTAAGADQVVHFISPFAIHAASAASGWTDVAAIDDIPEGGIAERKIKARSVLLSRRGSRVSCFDNSCAHLGMPLEMAEVEAGVITCSYHGFRYLLETGECLTAPEVQLKVHGVRVLGERVQVRLET